MITYDFECEKGHKFEMFRLGQENRKKWEKGKFEIKCTKCGTLKIKPYLAEGSGAFVGGIFYKK
jgi:hypothetical protein